MKASRQFNAYYNLQPWAAKFLKFLKEHAMTERRPDGKPLSVNPYKKDQNDPRWRAVEIRREYEQKGYDVVNGKGIYDPKTGKKVD